MYVQVHLLYSAYKYGKYKNNVLAQPSYDSRVIFTSKFIPLIVFPLPETLIYTLAGRFLSHGEVGHVCLQHPVSYQYSFACSQLAYSLVSYHNKHDIIDVNNDKEIAENVRIFFHSSMILANVHRYFNVDYFSATFLK